MSSAYMLLWAFLESLWLGSRCKVSRCTYAIWVASI
ncbi:hypothetical protein GLYMA_10G162651v4 [Glycine max]|nr:hypothetical protein GLYMA_10G162651v4 [Glycine max]KAH1138567.1 hypothetical protein GYH30_028184 [Glycine max]